MKLEQIECGNGSYSPKAVSEREVEGVQFLQLIMNVPSMRSVPRGMTEQRALFVWRPNKKEFWMPMSVSELDRVRDLGFSEHARPYESDDEQNKHIDAMVLLIDGEVVVVDA